MKIWVDADACPVVIKEILFKAARRTGTAMTLVANRSVWTPDSSLIDTLLVAAGADVADRAIVERVTAGDLVISEDIPLAAQVIEKGAVVLSPHGELLTADNVGARLSVRNFMDELRSGGVQTGGPAAFSKKDRAAFANGLDALLRRKAGDKR